MCASPPHPSLPDAGIPPLAQPSVSVPLSLSCEAKAAARRRDWRGSRWAWTSLRAVASPITPQGVGDSGDSIASRETSIRGVVNVARQQPILAVEQQVSRRT
uniref:Uncharacterized protein n=1 Tax=Chlamydomonas euryale TaxID=1486919 RepID=A0A7R9V283_9CHLO